MATKEQLAKIIASKAGGLCTPEADRRFDGMAGRGKMNEMYDPDPSSFDEPDDPWGIPGGSGEYEPRPANNVNYERYNTTTASTSRMPDAIKKSMLEQRIDTSSLSNTSVTDSLGLKPQAKTPTKREVVRENYAPQTQSSIDYALIKTIVKECIAESNASLLNEGVVKQMYIKEGKIKIVDNSGNIYSAKLEKIGNVKDKK